MDVDPDVDPATGWARRVLAAPLRCVRGEDTWRVPHGVTFADWVNGAFPTPPTTADLDHHVSTLFPPGLVGAPAWVRDPLIEMTERRVLRVRCPADDPAPGDGHPVPVPTFDPDTPEGELG